MEELKYNGKFVQVKEYSKDGVIWEKAYFPDSMVVFPITKDNEIIMVVENRPHEKTTQRLKFITGHIDQGESSIECAFREMQEEAGYKAEQLTQMFVHESSGTINTKFHYIIATELSYSKLPNPDGEDSIVEVKKIPLLELKRMIYNDKFKWTLATLGIFKILEKLKI